MEKKPDPHLIDDENPEWTEEMFQNAKRGPDALRAIFGQSADSLIRKKSGRPLKEHKKISTTIRLDEDVLEAFKAEGAGWQTHINALLRQEKGL